MCVSFLPFLNKDTLLVTLFLWQKAIRRDLKDQDLALKIRYKICPIFGQVGCSMMTKSHMMSHFRVPHFPSQDFQFQQVSLLQDCYSRSQSFHF